MANQLLMGLLTWVCFLAGWKLRSVKASNFPVLRIITSIKNKKTMKCKEVAVFRFKREALEDAIELNKKILSEMQKESENSLIDFEVYQSPKDPCVFTWLIDWIDAESAKATTDKWLTFPSNEKFSSSIESDIFYDYLEKR